MTWYKALLDFRGGHLLIITSGVTNFSAKKASVGGSP
jgi:hypothetical protein